jgi:hypothetical protein
LQFPIFGNFGITGNLFYSPQPMSISQKPHPASEVLLQTKGESKFDRAVTARSKLFPARFYKRNLCSSARFAMMPAAIFAGRVCLSITAINQFWQCWQSFLPPKLPIYQILLIG